MDVVDIITSLINSTGFPIAAFLLMFYQNMKLNETIERNTTAINEIREKMIDKEMLHAKE